MNQKACILLGVWGESYIDEFFQYSLPSLLAEGNIPALAKVYDTRFVFLSKQQDIAYFEKQTAYKTLLQSCNVSFLAIDDLIVCNNYSTTLTLAFDRAIKSTHLDMLSTYFIFLTADYVMANGSFLGLMRYMAKGYSGICAGNFQVNDSDMRPVLQKCLVKKTGVLSIKPRELLKASFKSLHTITLASLINQSVFRNYKANRFFYRHNNVMVGRFYLLHMLCIKPETMDYSIGASCDYSFIPEMCPSGNIAVIKDSDDYLVVEMQPKHHEVDYLSWGPYKRECLLTALREWTTQQHRANIQHSIYFHVDDLNPSDKKEAEDHLDAFITPIMNDLNKSQPVTHRGHPYWLSAASAFDYEREKSGYAPLAKNHRFDWLSPRRLRRTFYGVAPNVRPWHFRWREYYLICKMLRTTINRDPNRVVVLHHSSLTDYNDWLRDVLNVRNNYPLSLLSDPGALAELKQYGVLQCILIINLDALDLIPSMLANTHLFMHEDGVINVLILNAAPVGTPKEYFFTCEVLNKMQVFMNAADTISSYTSVCNNLTYVSSWISKTINKRFIHNRVLKYIALVGVALGLSLFVLIRNGCVRLFNLNFGFCTAIAFKLIPNQIMREIDDNSK